ncbi:ABC transporter G family member 22 [Nephila pilipes]|uniref:ABC transporter G family member 22 n=1 Tax=Nephila pilipes TaxID=299642 RepID=A0A8X6NED2_NEPPI|nr:ABC transporter G family member 22 [Nephila pilipes]
MLPLSYGLEVIHFLEHPIHNRPTIRSQEPPKRLKPEISLGPLNGSGEGGSGPTARQKEVELVFKDVCVSFEDKIILKDVSGMVRPGEILAIMGPSGSGKTTLLNTIGGRSEQMKITGGIVTVNGEEMNKQWRRKICYVMQQDVFFAELTLRETLEFSARLGLPDSMPYEQKMRQVDFIVDLLDLRACQDTIMGDVLKRGLSGGEKKRANIANELLQNPSLMLLDEPTSGLDSFTAFSLMDCLKKIVRENNKTLVVTVHQPSSQIFYMFDKLLLLCNGQVAYFGDTNKVVDFFSKIGMTIQEHYNPADFIMEKVKQSEEAQDKIIEAAIKQRKSDEYPKELQDPFFSVVIQPTSNFDGSNGKDLQPWSEINKYVI